MAKKLPDSSQKADPVRIGHCLNSVISFLWRPFSDLLYPPVCSACGEPADAAGRLLCQTCWDRIVGLDAPYCLDCREFIEFPRGCPNCGSAGFPVYALGYYKTMLQQIIHDLKFAGLKPLGYHLGVKLAGLIYPGKPRKQRFDAIIPIPLHPWREYRRGYNQAAEIGRGIADTLEIPLIPNGLTISRRTRQQAKLDHDRRAANISGAFAIGEGLISMPQARIFLVDDVSTTGATLQEARRILTAAGYRPAAAAVAATAA